MDWDEVNTLRSASKIYKYLEEEHLEEANAETLSKLEDSGHLNSSFKEKVQSLMPQKINESILERGEDQPFINVDGFDFDQLFSDHF